MRLTATRFKDQDVPGGVVDGTNNSFTLSAVPNPATNLDVYRNGLLQEPGTDYTLAGSNVIQFTAGNIPQPGDTCWRTIVSRSRAPDHPCSQARKCCAAEPGGTVNTTTTGSLGSCTIPSGLLTGGDHVEVRFDLAHQGTRGASISRSSGAGLRSCSEPPLPATRRCRATLTRVWIRAEPR